VAASLIMSGMAMEGHAMHLMTSRLHVADAMRLLVTL